MGINVTNQICDMQNSLFSDILVWIYYMTCFLLESLFEAYIVRHFNIHG